MKYVLTIPLTNKCFSPGNCISIKWFPRVTCTCAIMKINTPGGGVVTIGSPAPKLTGVRDTGAIEPAIAAS